MKRHFWYIFLGIGIFILGSCASITGFEEARTIGEGNHELNPSVNSVYMLNFFGDTDENFYPHLDLKYRYGVTDKLDVGVRVSSSFNIGAFAKFNIWNPVEKSIAIGSGLEFGSTLGSSMETHLPVYFSYYPNDNVTLNFSPRLISLDGGGGLFTTTSYTYLGANMGLLIGRGNSRLGLDFGFFNEIKGKKSNLFTVGIGGKFRIVPGKEASTPPPNSF
jgi:hypothetical protein